MPSRSIPYLGGDSLEPFLRHAERGVAHPVPHVQPRARAICRTCGSGDARCIRWWRSWRRGAGTPRGNCLLVVGATYPRELAEVRALVGDMPLLVPGVGAQGGDVEQVVKSGRTAAGTGLIVSSSRALLYASQGADFAQATRAATAQLRDQINTSRRATPRNCA